jgi:ArsR family metal-binding transcriptional regulator
MVSQFCNVLFLELSNCDFDKCFKIYVLLHSQNSSAISQFSTSARFRNLCLENISKFYRSLENKSIISPLAMFESIITGEQASSSNRRLSIVLKEINPWSWCFKWVEMRLMLTEKDKSRSKRSKQDKEVFVETLLQREKPQSNFASQMDQAMMYQLVKKLGPCVAESLLRGVLQRLDDDLDDLLRNVDCRSVDDDGDANDTPLKTLAAIYQQYEEFWKVDDLSGRLPVGLEDDQLVRAILESDWVVPGELETEIVQTVLRHLKSIDGFVSGREALNVNEVSPRRTRSSKPKRRKTSVLPAYCKSSPIIMSLLQSAVLVRLRCLSLLSKRVEFFHRFEQMSFEIIQCIVSLMSSSVICINWTRSNGKTAFQELLEMFDFMLTSLPDGNEKERLIHSSNRVFEEGNPPVDKKIEFQKRLPGSAFALEPRFTARRVEPTRLSGFKRKRSGSSTTPMWNPAMISEVEPWEILEGVLGNPLAQILLNESEFVSKSNIE